MIYVIVLLFLTACNLGPDLVGPVVPMPLEWKEENVFSTHEASPNLWWEVFEDEQLNCLELAAIASTPSLEAALHRVEQAWAEAGINRADLFPQLSLAPSFQSSGLLNKLFLPPQNIFAIDDIPPYRIHQRIYQLPINLNYELDLWGRIKKEVDAGTFNAEAEENAFRSSILTLTSEIASSYFTLRTLATQVKVSEEDIEQRKKAVEFYERRYKNGVDSLLDVESAKVELANIQATYLDLKKQETLESNRLATLVGTIPSEFYITPALLETPPPLIPAGIPSDILLNRPDIAELERTRAAENARVGAAWASFFPSFNLTAALGYLSPTSFDFLKWQSRYWSIGGTLDQTLFDGWRKCSNYHSAWARFDEADANYRQTVIQAFREVEDSLTSLRYERALADKYQEALNYSEKGLNLSQKRFERGLVPNLEVIDKERLTLSARLNTVNSLGNTYQATIQLIKALGGSWQNRDECLDNDMILEFH